MRYQAYLEQCNADSLTMIDAEVPRPGPGQVLVKMRAASLNYRDLFILQGLYPGVDSKDLVPLSDGAGEVVETGAGVDRFAAGDHVIRAVAAALAALHVIVRHRLSEDELRDWLWESWRFVKQIFPLLVVGVFVVGMIRVLIRPEWIEMLAGTNSLTGNLAGVVFGVFMYFPTLVEVPIAKMFLDLGMHRGPLLAYLMSDPELSLQSILIISAIIGRKKTFTYVGLVALFSAVAGLIYGAWIDGAALFSLALYLAGFIAALAVLLSIASRRATASSLKGV